eukprot:PRCOL_00000828-RA
MPTRSGMGSLPSSIVMATMAQGCAGAGCAGMGLLKAWRAQLALLRSTERRTHAHARTHAHSRTSDTWLFGLYRLHTYISMNTSGTAVNGIDSVHAKGNIATMPTKSMYPKSALRPSKVATSRGTA